MLLYDTKLLFHVYPGDSVSMQSDVVCSFLEERKLFPGSDVSLKIFRMLTCWWVLSFAVLGPRVLYGMLRRMLSPVVKLNISHLLI